MSTLTLVVEVACLGCGARYPKPAGRGTMRTNPGCPVCGYVGWTPTEDELTRPPASSRSSAGRLRRLVATRG